MKEEKYKPKYYTILNIIVIIVFFVRWYQKSLIVGIFSAGGVILSFIPLTLIINHFINKLRIKKYTQEVKHK